MIISVSVSMPDRYKPDSDPGRCASRNPLGGGNHQPARFCPGTKTAATRTDALLQVRAPGNGLVHRRLWPSPGRALVTK